MANTSWTPWLALTPLAAALTGRALAGLANGKRSKQQRAETVRVETARVEPRSGAEATSGMLAPLARREPRWHGVVLQTLSLALAIGLFVFVREIARPLALLLAAVVIAEAVAPIANWLERFVPRALGIVLVYLVLIGFFGLLGWFVVPTVLSQGVEVISRLPRLLDQAEAFVDGRLGTSMQTITGPVQTQLNNLAGQLISLPMTIVSSLFEIILIVVMSIYWLLAAPAFKRFVLSLFPEADRAQVSDVLREIGDSMGGFVRATVIDALLVGVIVYVGMLLIGVQFPVVVALVSGFGELIPIVGPFIGGGVAVAVALLNSPQQALLVLAFYVALQQLESHVLVPLVVKNQAHIPPILAVFALLAGAALGGILVALIAIPLAGALRVLVLRVAAPALRDWSGVARPGT